MVRSENISSALTALIENKNIPHAVLLEGEYAAENAEYLAAAAVCASAEAGEEPIPCGKCGPCLKAQTKNHPDIIYLEPQKPNNPYPVDFVREIRREAYIKPNEARRKVYIFTNADNISVVSQNALLKIIEEPPESVMFIICCNRKEMLLDTVISRVSVIVCGTAKSSISQAANELAAEMIDCVFNRSEYELIRMTLPLTKDRALLNDTLSALKSIFRKAYCLKSGAQLNDTAPTPSVSSELLGAITLKTALAMCEAADSIGDAAAANANAQLNVTRLCASLKAAAGR